MRNVANEHINFMANVYKIKEPHNFTQPQRQQEWRDVVDREIDALESNKTWSITDLPSEKK